MNLIKLIALGVLFWVLLLAEKFLFLEYLGLSAPWQAWAYFILIVVFARILSRQLGVINFLEAIFASLVWLLMILVLDSFVVKNFMSPAIFVSGGYWWSYLVALASIFFLHKKRHIHIRKEQKYGNH